MEWSIHGMLWGYINPGLHLFNRILLVVRYFYRDIIFFLGTAHCADMYTLNNNSLSGLFAVQDLIGKSIKKWLSDTTVTENRQFESLLKAPRTAVEFLSRSIDAEPAREPTEEVIKKFLILFFV